MTITYDDNGICTRCGSTGYYPGSYTSDSSFEDERACIKPCKCRGWRPVEFAAPEDRLLLLHKSGRAFDGRPCDYVGLATHWQPMPQPPEGV